MDIVGGISITGHGSYDRFTLNEETARLFNHIEAGDLSFLSGAVGLRYTYVNGSDAHPYVEAGIGMYRVSSSNRKVFREGSFVERRPQRTASEMGAHFVLGSLFWLDDTYAVFFEPRYVFYDVHEGFGDTLRYFTLRLGVEMRL